MAEPGTPPVLGIIGGSGIYEIEGLADLEWRRVESPFGEPSDELLFGRLDGQRIIFLPLEALRVQCGDEEQTTLWNRLQTIYAEDLPVLPLYFRSNAYIMPKWLRGVTPTGNLNPSSLWVENWTVAE